MKRVIREWFRHNQAKFPAVDLMVSIRRPLTEPAVIKEKLALATTEIESSAELLA